MIKGTIYTDVEKISCNQIKTQKGLRWFCGIDFGDSIIMTEKEGKIEDVLEEMKKRFKINIEYYDLIKERTQYFPRQDSKAISSLSIDTPVTIQLGKREDYDKWGDYKGSIDSVLITPIEPIICMHDIKNNKITCE